MSRTITLIPALAGLLAAHAQPTLTHATNAPQPGAIFTWLQGNHIAPGAGGANMTWDYSALVPTSESIVQLVDPALLPNAGAFPGSTVAELQDGGMMFFEVTSDGAYLGGFDDGDGWTLTYTDKGRYMQFPATYLTSWTDEATATFGADGTVIQRHVDISAQFDGYGTLILPGGSFSDVLRLHWQEVITDDSEMFTMSTTNDSYLYYAVGIAYPLLQTVSSLVEIMGFEMLEEFAQWQGVVSTGISANEEVGLVKAFPNPATDRLEVFMAGHALENITLTDASGRMVRDLPVTAGDRISIDVQDLDRGAYILSARARGGARAHGRVVLQ